jgi:hypothetical protein
MDIGEFTPSVDLWFKAKREFTLKETEVYVILKTGNIDLYFTKKPEGKLIYDGWGCDVSEMGIKIPIPPHDDTYDENVPGSGGNGV